MNGTIRLEINPGCGQYAARSDVLLYLRNYAESIQCFSYEEYNHQTGETLVTITPYDRSNVSVDILQSDTMDLLSQLAAEQGKPINEIVRQLAEEELNELRLSSM